jgi:citrate synthase
MGSRGQSLRCAVELIFDVYKTDLLALPGGPPWREVALPKKMDEFRSDIAWSTPDRITVKGLDLCTEILGVLSLGDIAFLEITDRIPNERESIVFNAIAVTLVEHGLTPSAITARMTYAGAPEAMQAAIAAGLCGLGSVFVGSMETAARMLQQSGLNNESDINALAEKLVSQFHQRGQTIPGLGHHFHKPIDPRTPRLFELAAANGFNGRYVELMQAISKKAGEAFDKPLNINATGAIAAIASEMGIAWNVIRGIGVMARAIGLVGHIREEIERPLAREIKRRSEEAALSHIDRS